MNQQNPNIPNAVQQNQQQQQGLNLNLQNDVPNANWRDELNIQDRSRFISQL